MDASTQGEDAPKEPITKVERTSDREVVGIGEFVGSDEPWADGPEALERLAEAELGRGPGRLDIPR